LLFDKKHNSYYKLLRETNIIYLEVFCKKKNIKYYNLRLRVKLEEKPNIRFR